MVTPLGSDDQVEIIGEDAKIDSALAGLMEIAVVDPKGTKATPDSARVTIENVIEVAMEDFSVMGIV
jgi:hypothetical protein